jgi:chitinase
MVSCQRVMSADSDLDASQDFAGYWSEVVTHDAPLYGNISASAAIAQFKEIGIPASKLNLGIPAYGYMFYNTDGTGMGGNMSTEGNRIQGTWDTAENNMSWTGNFDYSHIQQAFANNSDWTYEFDNATAGSWLWNKEKNLVLTYDSAEAVQVKSDYAEAEGLGGMFVWELSNDRAGDLVSVMAGVVEEPEAPETSSTASEMTSTVSNWGPGEYQPTHVDMRYC